VGTSCFAARQRQIAKRGTNTLAAHFEIELELARVYKMGFMSSGWAVNVKTSVSNDLESSETYYARVSDRKAAEDAVRRHLAVPSHIIEARLPVQSSVFDALGISDGAVVLKAGSS